MNIQDMTTDELDAAVSVLEGWVPPTDPLIGEFRKLLKQLPGAAHVEDDEPIWLERRDLDARWWRTPGNFCGSWAKAGSIIERERIAVSPGVNDPDWWAQARRRPGEMPQDYRGPTPLIAAMRAYVASKVEESPNE